MNSIGNKIYEARKLKGLTQEELAELSKVNLRTIQRIENNKNEPRGKTLSLICDVLEIKIVNLSSKGIKVNQKGYIYLIINGVFLLILNMSLMGIFGYLTLDLSANMNSRFGGVLLSFFLPLFIVWKTHKMRGIERMLKFGSGFIIYIILVLIKQGFPVGFVTGLFICLAIALGVLFYGNVLIKNDLIKRI